MENNNIFKILVFILVIVVVGMLGWYFTNNEKDFQKSFALKDNQENEPSSKSVDNSDFVFDKMKANKSLEDFTQALLYINLTDDGSLVADSQRNNDNLLNNEMKVQLCWYYLLTKHYDINKINADVTPTGDRQDGSYGVNFDYFKDYYQQLFGEEISDTYDFSILGYEDGLKDNVLYGIISTQTEVSNIVLKAQKIEKKDNEYSLIIDCLGVDRIQNTDEYFKSEAISYPQDLVVYNLKVSYLIKNGEYVMLSMVAY